MADNIQKEGMLKVGTTLANGKYRIDQYLASGGFGNTYVATDTAFDEKVAIKELFIKGVCGRDTASQDISISLTENKRAFSAQQEKFRKEAKRIRKLTNDKVNNHIVRVHDLFDENGTSYYVMDFVEGESLSTRMKRTKKPMKESELMLIIPQVLDALECVHAQNIWHLDLKPANIMIDAKGNVQLIDFGASKQLKNSNGDSLSTSSALAYTRGFAPSEQMEQKIEKFGPWTDLYSLGATMYNLLTLQEPPSPSDIDENPTKALQLPKGISEKTRELIFWLMKPNRQMRPQNVTAVKQFLAEAPESTGSNSGNNGNSSGNGEGAETDSGDTELKPGGHGNGGVTPPNPEPKENSKVDFKKIILGIVVLACLGGGAYSYKSCTGGKDDIAVNDSVRADTVALVKVTDKEITVTSGPDNMRKYKYTGELRDSAGALPNGTGTAKFAKYGDIPSSTYEGNFVDGICEDNTGKASMTFSSGDKYVGTFVGGYYNEGTYTQSDGSYFKGTFQKGSPYNGKWYNANGSFSANVVNGKEQ